MDNRQTQTFSTVDTVQTEQKQATTDLGKFKDVEALKEAYENLQAEFTRRSQRLKVLEANNAASSPDQASVTEERPSQTPSSLSSDRETFLQNAVNDEDVKREIISRYVSSVAEGKGVPLVVSGVQPVTERRKTASLKEASQLAKQFLNHQTI